MAVARHLQGKNQGETIMRNEEWPARRINLKTSTLYATVPFS